MYFLRNCFLYDRGKGTVPNKKLGTPRTRFSYQGALYKYIKSAFFSSRGLSSPIRMGVYALLLFVVSILKIIVLSPNPQVTSRSSLEIFITIIFWNIHKKVANYYTIEIVLHIKIWRSACITQLSHTIEYYWLPY